MTMTMNNHLNIIPRFGVLSLPNFKFKSLSCRRLPDFNLLPLSHFFLAGCTFLFFNLHIPSTTQHVQTEPSLTQSILFSFLVFVNHATVPQSSSLKFGDASTFVPFLPMCLPVQSIIPLQRLFSPPICLPAATAHQPGFRLTLLLQFILKLLTADSDPSLVHTFPLGFMVCMIKFKFRIVRKSSHGLIPPYFSTIVSNNAFPGVMEVLRSHRSSWCSFYTTSVCLRASYCLGLKSLLSSPFPTFLLSTSIHLSKPIHRPPPL